MDEGFISNSSSSTGVSTPTHTSIASIEDQGVEDKRSALSETTLAAATLETAIQHPNSVTLTRMSPNMLQHLFWFFSGAFFLYLTIKANDFLFGNHSLSTEIILPTRDSTPTMTNAKHFEGSTTTSSSSTRANTPTHTSFSEYFETPNPPRASDDIPWPGSTYIIRSYHKHHILTLSNDTLQLKEEVVDGVDWQWKCVQKDGWLGFKNTATSTYLGHNNGGGFIATARSHQGWEQFCARRCPDGGYLLLNIHWWKLWKMDTGESGTLKQTEMGEQAKCEDGSLWEFVKL